MPTSSQALVWLKQLADFSSSSPRHPDAVVSPFIPFPADFIHQHENTVATNSSQHLTGQFPGANPQQSSPRRSHEGERLSRCVPLPPIAAFSDQQASSIFYDSKDLAAVTADCKQFIAIDLRETETATAAHDNEVQLTQISSIKIDNESHQGQYRGVPDLPLDETPHSYSRTGIDSPDEQNVQEEDARSTTSELRDNLVKATSTKSIDLPSIHISKGQREFLPFYYADDYHENSCSISKPHIIYQEDFKADNVIFQENDLTKSQPYLSGVLNLSLCGQSCPLHEDSSSCMGILSYNHQMKRHVWDLVPQKIRPPRANIRGRSIKNRKPVDRVVGTNFYDQTDKLCTRYKLHQKVRQHNRLPSELGRADAVNQRHYEGLGADFDFERCQKERKSDSIQAEFANDSPESFPEISSIAQLNAVINSLKNVQDISDMNMNEVSTFPQRRLYENLKCSGIINNGSYLFSEEDSEDIGPHFLDTLISAPQADDTIAELIDSQPRSCSSHNDLQSHKINNSPSTKENSKPVFRTFTGLTPTQKEKAICISQIKNPLPRDGPHKEHIVELPAVTSFPSSEIRNNNVTTSVLPTSDEDVLVNLQFCASLPVPAEAKVIGMRPELPPSRPNWLCFRTCMSGCSHSEVLSQIEAQRTVKVIWLQYEPTSLHYSDTASAGYRHLCMWLFELTPDSDTAGLLLEGFKLRGQRMNILHVDDVYREEYRTFNLCNEIYMEQRSKNLIKNKSKHFMKSGRLFSVN